MKFKTFTPACSKQTRTIHPADTGQELHLMFSENMFVEKSEIPVVLDGLVFEISPHNSL